MTRRLRVLQVYKDIYPPVVGGVETHIHDLCLGLRDSIDFTILVAHDRAVTERTTLNGATLIKTATWGRFAKAPLCPSFPGWIRKLARQADVVHYHLPNPTGVVAGLLARPKAPTVVTYHSDIVRQKWAMGVYGPLLRRFLGRAAVIMPTTMRYAETSPVLSSRLEQCRAIALGIDTAAFSPTPEVEARAAALRERHGGGPLIGTVGVLRAYKGLEYLIATMKDINPEARCLIAGDGEARGDLETLARETGVDDRVTFLGVIDDDEKVALLHAIDVFCLPSHLRSEAFGLSQIEAMASGTPVVACDLDTGVPVVNRHEETGLIVPPTAPREFAEAVNRLLDSDEERRAMGDTARNRARENYDRADMLRRVAQVYEEVAGRSE